MNRIQYIRSSEELLMSVRDAINQIAHCMRSGTLPKPVTVKVLEKMRAELRRLLKCVETDALPQRGRRHLSISKTMASQAQAWSQPELGPLCRQLVQIEHYYRHVL